MNIITASKPEIKSWSRDIELDINGEVYQVYLYWDEWDGYEVTWYQNNKEVEVPEVILDMVEETTYSIGYLLEDLADKQKENV